MRESLFLGNQVKNNIESYILGFIYADGTVVANGNPKTYKTTRINVQLSDMDYLTGLNNFLEGNLRVYNYKANGKIFEEATLSVYSIDFTSKIIKLGVSPRKTYSKESFVFDNIPDYLKWDFIRGYSDGNGSISRINRSDNYCFELCSNNEIFLDRLFSYIKIFVLTGSKITMGDGVKRIRIGGNNLVHQIKNNMYYDGCMCLNRKKFIFDSVPSPIIRKTNYKYVRLLPNAKYSVSIRGKSYGCFSSEKEAAIKYNLICESLGLQTQIIKGE